ncbi:type II toxin-antitoxin system RelE/ParE family toxin [Streptococcus sp. S784/96/1]|uniref:type II toxin-antitoxin system RelE/ParE family toxin n=1 Tax=Streptococcus sp. S784/96/1 TaxID=2653499 RepID=UPI001386A959
MEAIYHYIADDLQSPQTVMKQFEAIVEAIQFLETFPERCAIVQELLALDIIVRRLLVKNYSVFYCFDNNIVTVLRVLHQSSDLERLLFELVVKRSSQLQYQITTYSQLVNLCYKHTKRLFLLVGS